MTSPRSRMPLLALACAASALFAAMALLSRPEAMIGAGFEAALANARDTGSAGAIASARQGIDRQSFDPRHVRPSSLTGGPSLPVIGPVKIGEHLKITGATGEQDFEVVDVHPLPRAVLGGAGSGGQLLLVTLKADDDSGSTIRLLVEQPAEPELPKDPGRRAL